MTQEQIFNKVQDHNGYSKVPPLFTCPGWASGNGEIFDTLSLLMSHE